MKFVFRAAALLCALALFPRSPDALPADFERVIVTAGLNFPQCMRFAPDGRIFLGLHKGEIAVVKDGKLLPTPFAKVPVNINQRENMIGLAVDPEFISNGNIFLFYYADVGGSKRMRISRFTASKADPDVADAGETVILDSIYSGVYTGGATFFGADGMLYAATGMGGSQDSTSLNGKLIRINPKTWPNVIPPDNPFVGRPKWRGEIWALGFREPFTGAVDPVNGRMVVNDVGESGAEEVNLIRKGGNYGHPACEGKCAKPGFDDPWLELKAADPLGRYNVITGGAFYYGNRYPAEYQGAYFFGDWGRQKIHVKKANDSALVFDAYNLAQYIQFDVGPDGYLYALDIRTTNNSVIHKLTYKGAVGIPSTYAGLGRTGRLGAEFPSLRAGSNSQLRFFLGERPLLHGRVEVFDLHGNRIHVQETRSTDPILVWNFQNRKLAGGTLLYRLQARTLRGEALDKWGKLLLQAR